MKKQLTTIIQTKKKGKVSMELHPWHRAINDWQFTINAFILWYKKLNWNSGYNMTETNPVPLRKAATIILVREKTVHLKFIFWNEALNLHSWVAYMYSLVVWRSQKTLELNPLY